MLFCTRVPPSVNGAKATLKNLERIGMAHALAAPDARAGFVENMDRRLFQGDVESDKCLMAAPLRDAVCSSRAQWSTTAR
jgi:hypothetical protein